MLCQIKDLCKNTILYLGQNQMFNMLDMLTIKPSSTAVPYVWLSTHWCVLGRLFGFQRWHFCGKSFKTWNGCGFPASPVALHQWIYSLFFDRSSMHPSTWSYRLSKNQYKNRVIKMQFWRGGKLKLCPSKLGWTVASGHQNTDFQEYLKIQIWMRAGCCFTTFWWFHSNSQLSGVQWFGANQQVSTQAL